MKSIFTIVLFLTSTHLGFSQHNKQKDWKDLIKFSDIHLKKIITHDDSLSTSVNTTMQRAISLADETFSLSELLTIVNICSEYCNNSESISISLTNWLKENHSIYRNRTPTETNQFRIYLLSSLCKFSPNAELYKYVKSELMFGGHAFNIAAAASTAKIFTDKSDELIPLMEPFLNSAFRDQWIDITTPELNYPITNPTKVRYEIIHTFIAYGASAYRSVKVLNEIVECGNCDSYGHDSILYIKATKAIEYLRKVTPACCRKENIDKTVQTSIRLIDKQDRGMVSMSHLKFIDQDGQNIIFDDLKAKPFVLTFFYTQCANPLKCASTVHRLGELEKECIKNNLMNKIGIYGMTYDSDFDTPKILKKYGKMYGVTFNNHMKFLKTVDPSTAGLSDQLQLRVNYGAGSVNQHGIQLFIFDKNEKIAALSDNEVWAVDDVYKILLELTKE